MAYEGIVGIAILRRNNTPRVLHVRHVPIPPNLHSIPDSSCFLCTSSNGLLLFLECTDKKSQFHICNPFLDYSTGYTAVTTQGMPSQASTKSAVLSLDLSNPSYTVFYISCPHEDENGICGFTSYSYHSGWRPYAKKILLHKYIIPGTAISCDNIAYWLTDSFTVVSYDPINQRVLPYIHCGCVDFLPENAQLGVVMGDRLCLVIANSITVRLHLLAENKRGWQPLAFAQLDVRSMGMPKVWRFESARLQVLLLIDKAIYLWENECPILLGSLMVLNFVSRGVLDVADVYVETALPIMYSDLKM